MQFVKYIIFSLDTWYLAASHTKGNHPLLMVSNLDLVGVL